MFEKTTAFVVLVGLAVIYVNTGGVMVPVLARILNSEKTEEKHSLPHSSQIRERQLRHVDTYDILDHILHQYLSWRYWRYIYTLIMRGHLDKYCRNVV